MNGVNRVRSRTGYWPGGRLFEQNVGAGPHSSPLPASMSYFEDQVTIQVPLEPRNRARSVGIEEAGAERETGACAHGVGPGMRERWGEVAERLPAVLAIVGREVKQPVDHGDILRR